MKKSESQKIKNANGRGFKKRSHNDKIDNATGNNSISNNKLYALIIILVLALAVVLIYKFVIPAPSQDSFDEVAIINNGNTVTYKGFVFNRMADLWYLSARKAGTNLQFNIPFHYAPHEINNLKRSMTRIEKIKSSLGLGANQSVKEIKVVGNPRFLLNESKVYITFYPLENSLQYVALSSAELSIKLAQVFNVTPIAACSVNETDACADRPIIDCSSKVPTIYVKVAHESMINVSGNCVVLQGDGSEIVRATDKLLMILLGILD